MISRRSLLSVLGAGALAPALHIRKAHAKVSTLTLDYATYNPVGLVLKDKGFLEAALQGQGVEVRWVQTLGSNKALEFLNAGSIDFGSTYAAASLQGRVNGNPIKAVYVYTRPNGVALVKGRDSRLTEVGQLKGKRVAVTRGTDPHIYLIRALAKAGLRQLDIQEVLLQHPDGRTALVRGDVDAWSGLDPLTAAAELENGAEIFYQDPALSTWGFLNVRENFAREQPELVRTVVEAYLKARAHAQAHPQDVVASLAKLSRLPTPVVERQLKREDFSQSVIGAPQTAFVRDAGLALQSAGVFDAKVDIDRTVTGLIDTSFHRQEA